MARNSKRWDSEAAINDRWVDRGLSDRVACSSRVDHLRLNINPFTSQQVVKDVSVVALVNHYREYELPDIFYKDEPDKISDDEPRKSWSTQDTYDGYLRKWIVPRWRSYRLSEVKADNAARYPTETLPQSAGPSIQPLTR